MDARLDAIALLYLSFAHASDGALSGDEMRLLAAKLRVWQPDAALESVGDHLRATVDRYKKLGDRDAKIAEARRCAASLAGSTDAPARAHIADDLRELATVDGAVTDEESALLAELVATLGGGG